MASEIDAFNNIYQEEENGTFEHLVSIYPISSTIATYLPAGDLISLSRSSKTLRSHTHAFSDLPRRLPFGTQPHPPNSPPNPFLRIGDHQTRQWAILKSLAPFICSFPSHKDLKSAKTNPCHACKFCSRPICKTCIVRSFFTDPKSSKLTYKHRARYLCPKCWSTGNLRKDFRFPIENVSREQVWKGRGYAQRGNWCGCSASEDNWVCGECKSLQNASGFLNLALSDVPVDGGKKREDLVPASGEFTVVKCYGLGCDAMIDQVDRDRRRICLWCSKPLVRAYGGDDRLRWEEKQIEIRAAAAASRSADIDEWTRKRLRSLTMSRREMRGTEACKHLTGSDGPEHDEPIFVRHLDTINYRKYMSSESAPSGDSVYQSKHGRWTYSRQFLIRVGGCAETKDGVQPLPLPSGIDVKTLFLMNMDIGLPGARTNSSPHFRRPPGPCNTMLRFGAQLHNAGLLSQKGFDWLLLPHGDSDGMLLLNDKLFTCLDVWENLPEELQINWKPPRFWDLAAEAGVLKKKRNTDSSDESPRSGSSAELQKYLDDTKTGHPSPAEDEDESGDDKAVKAGDVSEDDYSDGDGTESDTKSISGDDHATPMNHVGASQDNQASAVDP